MADTFHALHYHVVFSTKERVPQITPDIQDRVWAFMGGIVRENNGIAILIGGMPDHIHILLRLRPDTAVADMVRRVKSLSSKWINGEKLTPTRFAWQSGYSVFTVSKSTVSEVRRYIENQAEHHKEQSFIDEYRSFLAKHELDAEDERIWG